MNNMNVLLLVLSCYFTVTGGQEEGVLRLMDGKDSYLSGRVEIYMKKEWGTVQYDSSQQKGVAQTVCQQLGYGIPTAYGTVEDLGFGQASSDKPVLLSGVRCPYTSNPLNGNLHILRCDYNDTPSTTGDHKLDMGVKCEVSLNRTYDTEVRLVQGNDSFPYAGYLEIYLNEEWGPVCNLGTDGSHSVCRQLGYTGAANSAEKAFYQGNRMNKLNLFQCGGTSHPCLRDCFTYPASDITFACSSHSFISCTFAITGKDVLTAGSELLCSHSSDFFLYLIVGVAAGVLMLLVLVVLVVVICCCCIPGCIINSNRKRASYRVISS